MSDTEEEILSAIEDGSIADKLSTPLSAEEIDALVTKATDRPRLAVRETDPRTHCRDEAR